MRISDWSSDVCSSDLGVAFNAPGSRIHAAARVEVPERLKLRTSRTMSTQQAFGGVLHELSRGNSALASRIVTTSPDVTVSTNLGPWVNQRGIFRSAEHTSELQSLMRISYAVFCLTKKIQKQN